MNENSGNQPPGTHGSGRGGTPPFQFLTRLVPLAVIAVMLMLLLPHLRRNSAEPSSHWRMVTTVMLF